MRAHSAQVQALQVTLLVGLLDEADDRLYERSAITLVVAYTAAEDSAGTLGGDAVVLQIDNALHLLLSLAPQLVPACGASARANSLRNQRGMG